MVEGRQEVIVVALVHACVVPVDEPLDLHLHRTTQVQFWALSMSVRHASRALCLSRCIAAIWGLCELHPYQGRQGDTTMRNI
jgi:hypothetical protein